MEPNGTSLQNYANADAIAELLERMLKRGIPPSSITILTIYKGQKSIVSSRLETVYTTVSETEEKSWKVRDVATVDSYRGQESDIRIVDPVTAHERSLLQAIIERKEAEFDDMLEG